MTAVVCPNRPVITQETDPDTGRRIYIATYPDGEEWVGPSVTTILQLSPKPWMPAFAAKAMAEELKDHIRDKRTITMTLVDACKKAHERVSRAGRDFGSQFHDVIEAYQNDPDSWEDKLADKPEEVRIACETWKGWYRRSGLTPLMLETPIFSRCGGRAWCYGGKKDGLYVDPEGRNTLVDHKSSNVFDHTYPLQTVAYAKAVREMELVPDVQRLIINRCGKDGTHEVWDSADPKCWDFHPEKWPLLWKRFLALRQQWHVFEECR